jgi:hypothetical protein
VPASAPLPTPQYGGSSSRHRRAVATWLHALAGNFTPDEHATVDSRVNRVRSLHLE